MVAEGEEATAGALECGFEGLGVLDLHAVEEGHKELGRGGDGPDEGRGVPAFAREPVPEGESKFFFGGEGGFAHRIVSPSPAGKGG